MAHKRSLDDMAKAGLGSDEEGQGMVVVPAKRGRGRPRKDSCRRCGLSHPTGPCPSQRVSADAPKAAPAPAPKAAPAPPPSPDLASCMLIADDDEEDAESTYHPSSPDYPEDTVAPTVASSVAPTEVIVRVESTVTRPTIMTPTQHGLAEWARRTGATAEQLKAKKMVTPSYASKYFELEPYTTDASPQTLWDERCLLARLPPVDELSPEELTAGLRHARNELARAVKELADGTCGSPYPRSFWTTVSTRLADESRARRARAAAERAAEATPDLAVAARRSVEVAPARRAESAPARPGFAAASAAAAAARASAPPPVRVRFEDDDDAFADREPQPVDDFDFQVQQAIEAQRGTRGVFVVDLSDIALARRVLAGLMDGGLYMLWMCQHGERLNLFTEYAAFDHRVGSSRMWFRALCTTRRVGEDLMEFLDGR